MKSKNFILFADCLPIKGANRSLICDVKNNQYHFIPNGLYDIIEKYNGETINFVKKEFENEYDEIIDEYFDFLFDNKLIFFNENPQLFPKINNQWHSPSLITNMIIDYDEIMHELKSLLPQFEKLKCSHIQLRFFKKISLDYITEVVQILKEEKSRIVSIDFVLPFHENFNIEAVTELIAENSRIHSIVLFNSLYDKSYPPIREKMGYIMHVKRNIVNESHCGIINQEYFYSNITLYTESQQHNTCLNRKISIDKDGNIRNCPSMPKHFGNIKDTTLEEALNHPDFKKYWNVNKDMIAVCKDCEFRHICTDCRAYTERTHFEEDIDLSKPLKCGYNPYTNVWEEWSTNPLKEKAIEYYGMQDLVKNN
ncbi:grasp-with-spasm system SPASM domain peptide maturase [Flavobacterium sp.]|uniref:grasp-with-spasm system SPASM domain peptide maturase n=1 Tax=Flavobacterium sp. TaxID=239 RepID=UPI0037BF5935